MKPIKVKIITYRDDDDSPPKIDIGEVITFNAKTNGGSSYSVAIVKIGNRLFERTLDRLEVIED